ncbi:MAG TPA: peptidylprolyl isomerase [Blastocatellia bacterium]|nr:peptidylprolyl isomerase [Blastocatellia bacterium]
MKRAASILCLCLLAIIAGCRGGHTNEPVIATIKWRDEGGRAIEIKRGEFERFLAFKLGEFNAPDTPDSLRSELLDEYIRRRIVLEEAARNGITVTDADIDQAALANPQVKSRSAAADLRDETARDLLYQKYRQSLLGNARPSPEEIQAYVEQKLAQMPQRTIMYVREIRVQTKEEADELRREITEDRKDFATIARLRSEAANAEQGGLARYDEGQLPAVLEKAVAPLRPGEVSPVIKSDFGFHIFKLERRVQPDLPEERRAQLDERPAMLRDEFIARRNQEVVDNRIEQLVAATTIQINGAALGFTYTGQLRHN